MVLTLYEKVIISLLREMIYLGQLIADEAGLLIGVDFDVGERVHDIVFLFDGQVVAFVQKDIQNEKTLLENLLVLVVYQQIHDQSEILCLGNRRYVVQAIGIVVG